MKANLISLNDTLFEMVERINDDSLKGEKLNEQLVKAKAISDLASNIINNSKLMLDVGKFMVSDQFIESDIKLPKQIAFDTKL